MIPYLELDGVVAEIAWTDGDDFGKGKGWVAEFKGCRPGNPVHIEAIQRLLVVAEVLSWFDSGYFVRSFSPVREIELLGHNVEAATLTHDPEKKSLSLNFEVFPSSEKRLVKANMAVDAIKRAKTC